MTAIKPPEKLLQQLRTANRFLLSGHLNPDGDSIGSALGLKRILGKLGKSATIWNHDPSPDIYRRLPDIDRIHVGPSPPVEPLAERFDCVIALECPTLDRSGLAEHLDQFPVLNLDHHLGNENYGRVNWVDTEAPALGEMILRLAKSLGAPLAQEAATALLVALTSDTGSFRFSNADARAFEAAAELVRAGARPAQVAEWLYESRSAASIRLLGEMLASLQLDADGRIASVLLSKAMFERAGATAAHGEGLIDYPRSIEGVEAVVLVRELDESECKVSLRSRGSVNVEVIARQHAGGGHRNAAGYKAPGRTDEVRRQAVVEIETRLDDDS